MKRLLRLSNIAVVLSVAVPLLLAFRLWSFSYFWIDDFGNTFWVQADTASHLIESIVNPLSTYYRPLGLLFYWVLYRTAGLNPLPYHLVGWALHAINTFLVFAVLRRLLKSPVAAAAGAIPFAFRVNFADMYWSFGTIFELTACCLMLVGLWLYIRYRPSFGLTLVLTAIYVLAIRSKEMAITLVVVWLLYDWYARRRLRPGILVIPVLAMVWFAIQRAQALRSTDPTLPYYMDFRLRTFVDGIGQYFSWLYGLKLPAALWSVLLVASFLCFLYFRNRIAVFFLAYTILTFMPVIFLVNHRWPYFWYIPFFGIAGLFGVTAKYFIELSRKRLPLRRLVQLNVLGLLLWSASNSTLEYFRSARTRAYEASVDELFRSFVSDVGNLPSPEPNATLYFTEIPPHFNAEILNDAVHVILGRSDVNAEFVATFPGDAKWKLRFSGGRLERFK